MRSRAQLSDYSCTGARPCLFHILLLLGPIPISHPLEIFEVLTPSFPSKQTQRHGWEPIRNSEWKTRGNICGNTLARIDVVDVLCGGVHQCIQLKGLPVTDCR
jgi:hypothetical protein